MVADKQGLQRGGGGCALFSQYDMSHKVVLIPDYLQSTFHIFVFSSVLFEVLTHTLNSKNVLFI